MSQIGFTYKLLADDRKFKKVALRYHVVTVSFLFVLLRFVFQREKNRFVCLYERPLDDGDIGWCDGIYVFDGPRRPCILQGHRFIR